MKEIRFNASKYRQDILCILDHNNKTGKCYSHTYKYMIDIPEKFYINWNDKTKEHLVTFIIYED